MATIAQSATKAIRAYAEPALEALEERAGGDDLRMAEQVGNHVVHGLKLGYLS